MRAGKSSMSAPWRIELLGWLRATQGDRIVRRFRMQKAGALLAYLAYYPYRSHPRTELIELLWPECDPEVGRHNLRQALFSLRRQFEPCVSGASPPPGVVIVADRVSVQLNLAAVTTDVAQFEASLRLAARSGSRIEAVQSLTEAVELYRGDLLPGCCEGWVLTERQRLAEAFLQALSQLILRSEQAGDLRDALQWARRAVAADPLREEGHHALIRLLAATGQSGAALRQYRDLEHLLAEQLGAAPAVETRTLAQQIRSQPPAGRSPLEAIPPASSAAGATDSPHPPASHLHPPPPDGTVTFLLAELGAEVALTECQELLRPLIRGHSGYETHRVGSAFVVAFQRAADAMAVAVAARKAEVRKSRSGKEGLRIVVHTGDVERRDDGYHGPVLQHGTRLLLAAHPGQILVSEKSAILLRDELEPGLRLVDLGLYRLREGAPPEPLFQVEDLELPPVRFPPPHAPAAHTGHLPLPLDRFCGREREMAELRSLLSGERRLVTLTGPGGSGKTRLALEAAAVLRPSFGGAAWFVPLAGLTDPQFIADRILDALRLPRSPHLRPLQQVVAFLSRLHPQAGYPALLLLDNFEHLATGGVPPVRTLLEQVERLVVLVTSRHHLGLPGEQEFPVAPLPVPGESDQTTGDSDDPTIGSDPSRVVGRLSSVASVSLFVDRAQAVRPDFQLTRSNAAAVAALCTRLEGLPLSLELAAARVGVLTPRQMLSRVGQRFELLVGRGRESDPRHRSLRAALDWSYELLSGELKRFFRRLSVFRGGWTLAAAEAVCAEPRALEYLEQLRASSLVEAEEREEGMRCRLLETLREYGAEKLTPEERTDLARGHARYFVGLADAAEPHLTSGERGPWMDQLDAEQDNLRAALAWSLGSGSAEERDIGLRIVGALTWFWFYRSYLSEGRRWVGAVLAREADTKQDSDSPVRTSRHARALFAAGLLAFEQGDQEASNQFLEESARLGRAAGDQRVVAYSLAWLVDDFSARRAESVRLFREVGDSWGLAMALAMIAGLQESDAAQRAMFEESRTLFEAHRDPWGTALLLGCMGWHLVHHGDYDGALPLFEQALELRRQVGHRYSIAFTLGDLADVALHQGNLRRAAEFYEESLALHREIGHKGNTAATLQDLGQIARYEGDVETASALLSESLAIWREVGDTGWIVLVLGTLGSMAVGQGDLKRAAVLFRESATLYRELGSKLAENVALFRTEDSKLLVLACLEGVAAMAAA
jgi:predicted ATPase/DNA-binding SARP family transcriptional activator